MTTYKGFFKPRNANKYSGTLPIIYRSSWELSLMRWCDNNNQVLKWGSESVIIPYYCEVDKKYHRYYPDFIVTFKNEGTYLIEIKPKQYTKAPKPSSTGKLTRRYLREALEYSRNYSKWNAAKKYAEQRGYKFQVWTEDTLKVLGIPII